MRTLLCLTVIVAACGCQEEQKAPNPTPPSTYQSDPSPLKEQVAKQKQEEGFNPKRVFQLKDLDSRTITVNGNKIKLWIMDTDSKREEGMMWLEDKEVKDNEGMLFVFSKEDKLGFWMQNTVLPLDIAYISSKGKVLNIAKGKSFDETSLPSSGPAQYVVELKQGMCQKFGISAGTVLQLPKDVKAKE